MSNAAVLRQHVRELYAEHLAAGTLPTSIRFWFYELVQKALIAKQASGVLKPGAAGQRRVDQNLIDAVTWLRERDEIP